MAIKSFTEDDVVTMRPDVNDERMGDGDNCGGTGPSAGNNGGDSRGEKLQELEAAAAEPRGRR